MIKRWWTVSAGIAFAAVAAPALASDPVSQNPAALPPLKLSLQPDTIQSIYAPPEVVGEEQGTNEGGVSVDFRFSYLTDYLFRGIDRSESGGSEDAPNLQFDGALKWDLGKWPHPFIGVFTNVYNSDPLSRFQEIRPYFGLEYTARPIIFTVGNANYIFPERDVFNTGELFAKIKLDDSYFFRTDDPVFSPYVFAAWDYDKYNALYVEFGISHDFVIEDTPLTLTPRAAVAYVSNNRQFRKPTPGAIDADPAFDFGAAGNDSGFQHYEFGMEATYALNTLLNIPSRYGKIDLKGYLFYTDGIDNKLRADTELWGGVGIGFSY
jgi:hypothetical protein